MTKFLIQSGNWSLQSNGYRRGTVDDTLSARLLFGSETDENYTVNGSVTLGSGKAAVIVNGKFAEDWSFSCLEMVLDPTFTVGGQPYPAVSLEAVQRDENGLETSRGVVFLAPFPFEAGVTYEVEVTTKTLSDGSKAVYGYVDGFLVVQAEDLDDDWSSGLCGFESLGAVGEFNDFLLVSFALEGTMPYGSLDVVKHLCSVSGGAEDEVLLSFMAKATAFVDIALAEYESTLPLDSVPSEVASVAEFYAAGLYLQKNQPDEKKHSYLEIAQAELAKYVASEYKDEFSFAII